MMPVIFPRYVEQRILNALSDTRVVFICGPRQSGKTTLALQIAKDRMPFFTLDDPNVLEFVSDDPVGFVRGLDRAVIDEAHRSRDLILAIKMAVDADPRPGRFLLTGSANLLSLPNLADSLAGRMSVIQLLPLAQAELHGNQPTFLEQVFAGEIPKSTESFVGEALANAVLAGGYPEALHRLAPQSRQDWHLNYVEAIIQRDVKDIARIDQMNLMPKLMRILAEYSGQLVNYSRIGSSLGANRITTQRYMTVFENLFIVHALQPWYTNRLKRLTKTPKLHFIDSGLLATLKDITPDYLARNRKPFRALLESFVFSELLKLASWSADRYAFYHFRDKERNEVDVVIEDRRGRVVGVEVKAAATVSTKDFSGLRHLAAACGSNFVYGMVLYDHDQEVPISDQMSAVPISALWS